MDVMKTEYEFLDLSDVKGAELSSLHVALYNDASPNTTAHNNWTAPNLEVSSCGSSTAGPSTVSSSVESVSGGECEMAPQSPARGAAGSTAPPPYAPPPPPYAPPPQQWPVAPPNVYVSQVTANVNVHGYMGQYYQPQPQYAPPPSERAPRPHRRDRRGKRAPSPLPAPAPQQAPPPPYYALQYPHYYGPAQAQGAPLYHLPMYHQPFVYGPYAYPPYYPEYAPGAEGEEKGPEEYGGDVVLEPEAVEYYPAPYGPGAYGPPEPALEYVPPVYLPPVPTHVPPPPLPPPQHHAPIPQHQPTPHQFNVHAKNFVHNPNKSYLPPDKTPPATASASASVSVETLPMKDLKINKPPNSPKQTPVPTDTQIKPASPADKVAPAPKPDAPKPAWVSNEPKPTDTAIVQSQVKSFPAPAVPVNQVAGNGKIPPQNNKLPKGPAAPFSGNKQPPKALLPQSAVPVQMPASAPKAPFGNRKRDGPVNRSPSDAESEKTTVEVKREPPLPPSKAPMPISITLQGQPVIVTNKPPFGHNRKAVAATEPQQPPQQPPPTASDFPPPPTPRNRTEPPVPTTAVPQAAPPAPGKSWASLFSKSSPAPAPAPIPAPVEEPSSPTTVAPPAQKPVAKVPPFDASPSLQPVPVVALEKPPVTTAHVTISYSEKTSINAMAAKPASPVQQPAPEVKEVPPVKEPTPALPVAPSPFADDPNSYRMGEFLSKYQLDHRPVSLMPRGLTNRSNYCYVNAILQALIACPPFYNMLKALPYQTRRGKSSTPIIDAMVELCYEFALLPPNARVSRRGEGTAGALPIQTGPPLDPSAGQKVLRALRPFPGSQEGGQEDAEEFLSCLLNGLNDEMLELMKLVEPEESKDSTPPNGVVAQEVPIEEDDDDDEWKVMGPKNKGAIERRWAAGRTPVGDMFRGRTRCRLHRAPHRDVTDAVQPFFTLQLDIERANSVKDALELLAGKDALEGVSDAWQQYSLERLPVILLLHLKCFQLDSEGHTAKIVKNIDFPIDLKIDPKIISSKLKYGPKQRMYKLFAVVYHEGVEAVKGHYLTDTFHGQAGWIRYDDSTVTPVNDVQVLKPKAPRMPYLLMYRRQDTLPVPHRATPKPE